MTESSASTLKQTATHPGSIATKPGRAAAPHFLTFQQPITDSCKIPFNPDKFTNLQSGRDVPLFKHYHQIFLIIFRQIQNNLFMFAIKSYHFAGNNFDRMGLIPAAY
jgi:hypothetical protein